MVKEGISMNIHQRNRIRRKELEEKAEWYLPVSQAAELLGCNWLEIQDLLKTGLLSFILMPDSRIKISEDSVFRLMEKSGSTVAVH
jgi:hypothetical protein